MSSKRDRIRRPTGWLKIAAAVAFLGILGSWSCDETQNFPSAGNPPVVNAFSVTPETSLTAPLVVTFTLEAQDGDGTIQEINVDFDDGTVQQFQGPGPFTIDHTYATAGTYVASAVATDNSGLIAASAASVQVGPPPDTVSFEADVVPLFGCSGFSCHTGPNAPFFDTGNSTNLYNALVPTFVNTTDPGNSVLLRTASGQVFHSGGTQWSNGGATYNLVRAWIADGAPQN